MMIEHKVKEIELALPDSRRQFYQSSGDSGMYARGETVEITFDS